MNALVFLVPLLPLAGAAVNGAAGGRMPRGLVGAVACLAMAASFIASLLLFRALHDGNAQAIVADAGAWLRAGDLRVAYSLVVDPLSAVMLLVVTGVGLLIHVYSIGYMGSDPGYARFMAYMNLFVFFMLVLVLGSNFVLLFVGWEGVGLCSYLLIGFWYRNDAFNDAAKKAFVMNRIGDLGFLLGLFLIYRTFGSLDYDTVFTGVRALPAGDPTVTAIALLLFVGAAGKSAQLPLHTWLPDAMAGPTPVSALIHAATMVTAGVYMVIRSNALFSLTGTGAAVVAGVGVATALFAASIGLRQNDIKKVLAYSTVSQLGFMFAAAGIGAYSTALFHLVTHAFFKALLFLCAGSVIHALGGEQDLRRMGGLRKALPWTHATCLIGTLSISGVPPLAGFFSKDEILAMAWSHSVGVFVLLAAASVLTAVYMFRMYWLAFHGPFRGTEDQRSHLHESPAVMTIPLAVLAVLAAAGGFVGMPSSLGTTHALSAFVAPVTGPLPAEVSHGFEYGLFAASLAVLAGVIAWTRYRFVVRAHVPADPADEKGMARLLSRAWFVDALYRHAVTVPLQKLGDLFAFFDRNILDGLVNAVPRLTERVSAMLRRTQPGSLGVYLPGTLGAVLLLFLIYLLLT